MPVTSIDSHLPAVGAERLTLPALRERFRRAVVWTPELDGDGRVLGDRASAAAAVLIGLVPRADGLRVLLTRRTAHLREHAGQISLPGGRVEAEDADIVAAALRETREEIGIPPAQVEIIGQLPTYSTITNFIVTPVVGAIEPPFKFILDRFEVDEVFEVPLAYLMNPAHHRSHNFEADGQRRRFLSMPWRGVGADGAEHEYFIWGATASMLRNLYRFLA